MRRSVLIVVLAIFTLAPLFCGGAKEQPNENLVVYCYDSFLGEWAAGEPIVKAFEEKTGIKVELVGCGAANQMMQKILYEGASCPADVVVGLSSEQSIDYSLFTELKLDSDVTLAPTLSLEQGVLAPFDYGYFSFVANTKTLEDLPSSLSDLTKDSYKDKIILIDPRTSSVGLGLLMWTNKALGVEGSNLWWESIKDKALTTCDSWSSAYGLFLEGEAPLVISYTTSPVYHVMYEGITHLRALEFTDGHYETIEYAAILKNSKKVNEATAFINFMLKEGQETLATANSMLPSNINQTMPEAFEYAIVPQKSLLFDREFLEANLDQMLKSWTEVMLND